MKMKNSEEDEFGKSLFSSSNICLNPLQDDGTVNSLQTLMYIVNSCIGPYGKVKFLQHELGGLVSVTSTSHRLFHQLSVKNVFSKTIVSTSKTQLKNYNDGGLYCTLLVSKLINNVLHSGYHLPKIGVLYDSLALHYLNCLNLEINKCVRTADFSNLRLLKSLVNTLLSSKPSCLLTSLQKKHLSCLLLKAFLSIVPSHCSVTNDINIHTLTVHGICPLDSKLFGGVLAPISKLDDSFAATKWKFVELKKHIKIALFTVSLSGDVFSLTCSIELTGSLSLLEMTLEHLEKLCDKLISDGVNIVLCQKVVHPKLRTQLQKYGILVLERLGSETTKRICYILGSNYNSSCDLEVQYGFISGVSLEKIGEKHFILFKTEMFPTFTFLLGHYNEEAVTELQVVCRQVVSSLFNLLKSGKVCDGGGCLEVYTLHHLKKKVAESGDDIINKTKCSQSQLQFAFDAFAKSVLDVCVAVHKKTRLDLATESDHGHLWLLRGEGHSPSAEDHCACGTFVASSVGPSSWVPVSDLKSSGDLACEEDAPSPLTDRAVLDEFGCKKSAMALAFEMASSILRTTVLVNNSC